MCTPAPKGTHDHVIGKVGIERFSAMFRWSITTTLLSGIRAGHLFHGSFKDAERRFDQPTWRCVYSGRTLQANKRSEFFFLSAVISEWELSHLG